MRRRRAGRVIVRDHTGAVLLAHATTGGQGWWFTPGGGTDHDETARQAAIRELAEETGIEVSLREPPVLHRRARFTFLDEPTEQIETFWMIGLDHRPAVVSHHLEDYEAASLDGWHWWPPDDLSALMADEHVFPACLPALLIVDRPGIDVPWLEEHLATTPTLVRPDRREHLPDWARLP